MNCCKSLWFYTMQQLCCYVSSVATFSVCMCQGSGVYVFIKDQVCIESEYIITQLTLAFLISC